jgi:pyruvate/2-oxoglutarate dehydrogenase complex dihydrolipoamide acyltransferase (E2) component
MTEGTLGEWLVADGDRVEVGTPIYMLQTDKVESEIEATAAGTITLIGIVDESYEVGAIIAEIN